MKKKIILIALTIALLATACTQNNKTNQTSSNNEVNTPVDSNKTKEDQNDTSNESKEDTENQTDITKSVEEQAKVMNELEVIIEENASEKEVIEFVDDNIEGLNEENASKLVFRIEDVQIDNLEDRTNSFFEGEIQSKMDKFDYTFTYEEMEKIDDRELKTFLQENRDSGYKVIMLEGSFYPIIDYDLYKKYKPYVTEEMKDYIDIQAVESNEISWNDAAIVISWDEVRNRALNHEKFINKYPDAQRIEKIKKQYLIYVMSYIYGANNTPAFDYGDNKLEEELKQSYLGLSINKDSRLYNALEEYIEILDQNDYELTEEVQNMRNEIFNNLQEELGISIFN